MNDKRSSNVVTQKSHLNYIETAFLQLSFSIKLWNYINTNQIDKNSFDIDLTISDNYNCIVLPDNQFLTYSDLILASENNISICFGVAAITLWEAIRDKNGLIAKNLNPIADKEQNLASLSYMIRCCFAHGTALPIWSIYNEKYKVKYTIGKKIIDLSTITEKQLFSYSDIGGYETLWVLKHEAKMKGML